MHDVLAHEASIVRTLAARLPHLLAVYAFGSRVSGQAGPDSDLDLAVLVEGYADPLLLWDLAGSVADVVQCDVDLLDMRAASTVMQYQILETGHRLHAASPVVDLFECYVYREKLDLDEGRRRLMADILKEGRVYHAAPRDRKPGAAHQDRPDSPHRPD